MTSVEQQQLKSMLQDMWSPSNGPVTAGFDDEHLILVPEVSRRHITQVHQLAASMLRHDLRQAVVSVTEMEWRQAGFAVLRGTVMWRACAGVSTVEEPTTASDIEHLRSSIHEFGGSGRELIDEGFLSYRQSSLVSAHCADHQVLDTVVQFMSVHKSRGQMQGAALASAAVYASALRDGRPEEELAAEQVALCAAFADSSVMRHENGHIAI